MFTSPRSSILNLTENMRHALRCHNNNEVFTIDDEHFAWVDRSSLLLQNFERAVAQSVLDTVYPALPAPRRLIGIPPVMPNVGPHLTYFTENEISQLK